MQVPGELREAFQLPAPGPMMAAVVYGPDNHMFFARLGALARGMLQYCNRAAAAGA